MSRPAALARQRLLLLEDEPLLRRRVAAWLTGQGAEVEAFSTVGAARAALKEGAPFDLALLDVNLPDGEGFDLLREKLLAEAAVVVMTAEGGVARAVEAMKLGAADFLPKPFELDELGLVFGRVAEGRRAARRAEQRRQAERPADPFFAGPYAAARAQAERILAAERRLPSRPPPVLIEGETGTGKTTWARWLHEQGPRAGRPFVHVNAAALPENLAESELFGHERGAFTDAKAARLGLFEAADGGTLFLDEIASLSAATQAKLLLVLEGGEVRRVGGNHPVTVDVRLIAASNLPLRELAAQGRFRADLYHRLDLLRLPLPPLRATPAEVPALARHLLAGLAARYGLPPPEIAPVGLRRLQRHPWPGNVRELLHELERALILGDGRPLDFLALEAGDTPLETAVAPGAPPAGAPAGDDWLAPGWAFPEPAGFSLEDAIKRLVAQALDQAGGNVSAAARLLGVSRDYVRYRLAALQKE